MTTVSIITICLNDIFGLKKTLTSVVKQDYEAIDYIIVDGGSTDGTIEYILDEINENGNSISFVSGMDSGRADAFNVGTKMAKGDLVYYLNSGDVLTKTDAISAVVKEWEESNVDVLGYDVQCNTGQIMCADEKDWSSGLFPHQGLFFKKNVFERVGLYNKYLINRMDYDLFLRMVKEGCSHKFIHRIIARFDTNGISSTNSHNSDLEGLGLKLIYNKYIKKDDVLEIYRLYEEEHKEDISANGISGGFQQNRIQGVEARYALMRSMLNAEYDNCDMTKFLKNRDIKNVAIYGMGDVGCLLYKMLKNRGICVKYGIDRDEKKNVEGLKIFGLDEVDNSVDAVIVSNAIDTDNIISMIISRMNCRVFTVADMIKELDVG